MYKVVYSEHTKVPRLGGRLGIIDHSGKGISGGVFVHCNHSSISIQAASEEVCRSIQIKRLSRGLLVHKQCVRLC